MGKKGKSTAIYTSTTAEGSESQAISATEITRKRQTRTAYRRSTEHLMETANEVLQLIHENPSSLSEQRTVILHQKITLNEKLKLVQGLDQEVLESLSEEDIVEETETADLFQDEVKFVIARLDAVFSAVSTPRMKPIPSTSDEPTSENRQTETVRAKFVLSPRVKVSKLELKKFDGDITKRCTFWEFFEASIHENTNIATIDKFHYSNSLLEKTASEAVQGLSLTTANYEETIAILKSRFGNKKMIISKHMESLLNMAPASSNHDLKGLRKIYDLVEVHVKGLKALGASSESYGSLLLSVLMNKIPQDLRLIGSMEVKGAYWGILGHTNLVKTHGTLTQ